MLSSSKVVLSRQFMIYFRTKLGQIVCRILDLIDGGCVGHHAGYACTLVGWRSLSLGSSFVPLSSRMACSSVSGGLLLVLERTLDFSL